MTTNRRPGTLLTLLSLAAGLAACEGPAPDAPERAVDERAVALDVTRGRGDVDPFVLRVGP
jgi:hypothetical protein